MSAITINRETFSIVRDFVSIDNTLYQFVLKPIKNTVLHEFSILSSNPNAVWNVLTMKNALDHIKDFMSNGNEAFIYKIHNKTEVLNSKTKRRGNIRQRMFDRAFGRNGLGYIKLSSARFAAMDEDEELLFLIVHAESENYNKIVTNFYRLCVTNY